MEERTLNYKEPSIIEHLAFFSVKYNVYLSDLYQALVLARRLGKSVCGSLSVEYRGIINDQIIFLIKKDNAVVVQFKVVESFLYRKNICFENWMNTDKIRRQIDRQDMSRLTTQVQDLRHGMKKVNLEAEVVETTKPALVHTQWGNSAMVTNALIADPTGKIKLCLWNEQVNSVNVGDTIQIKNATVFTYKGERQLRLSKNGTISLIQSQIARNPVTRVKAKSSQINF